MGQKLADAFFALLPFIAGIIVGGARRLWWLSAVHDSVLRHSYLQKDQNAMNLRMVFCSIVNGRKKFIDSAGSEIGSLVSAARFYGVVFVVTAVLLFALLMASWHEASSRYLKACLVFGAAALWVWFKWSLASSKHRTLLALPDGDKPAKKKPFWKRRPPGRAVYLTGERAEDGLPTRSIEEKLLEAPSLKGP